MTFPATCWEDAYRTQVEAVRELRAENAELRATLELVMAADERAVDAWRAAHPGTALVRPDRAALVAWLLGQNAALRAHAQRVGEANDRLVAEIDALRADKARTAALRSAEHRMTFPTTHEHHQSYPVAPRA